MFGGIQVSVNSEQGWLHVPCRYPGQPPRGAAHPGLHHGNEGRTSGAAGLVLEGRRHLQQRPSRDVHLGAGGGVGWTSWTRARKTASTSRSGRRCSRRCSTSSRRRRGAGAYASWLSGAGEHDRGALRRGRGASGGGGHAEAARRRGPHGSLDGDAHFAARRGDRRHRTRPADLGVAIRPATEADLDTIIELINALALYEKEPEAVTLDRDELRGHLFGARPYAEVLMAEDELLGRASASRSSSTTSAPGWASRASGWRTCSCGRSGEARGSAWRS